MAMYSSNDDASRKGTPTVSKKPRLVLFGGVIFVLCIVMIVLCQSIYSARKDNILATQEERLLVNATATADMVKLWVVDLENQARRISDAELYQVFAQDLTLLEKEDADLLNDPSASVELGEDLAFLVEQMPMMRNLLLDFVTYNGLQDVRLVSPDGTQLLSSLARPMPLQDEQIDAIKRAAETVKIAFGEVRGTSNGMLLDYAVPLLAPQMTDETSKPEAIFLLTTPITSHIANFLTRGAGPAQQLSARLLQRAGDTWESLRPETNQPALSTLSGSVAKDANLPFGRRSAVDDKDELVYSLGVSIAGIDWLMVQEVPVEVIDRQLEQERNLIFGAGAFLCLSVLLMLALMWWIMIGREQRSVAQQFQKLYQVIKQQKGLLDSINISLDVGLIMVDVSGDLHVVNRAFAEIVHKDENALSGQNLHTIMPAETALQIQEAVASVATSGLSSTIEIVLVHAGEDRLFRATLFPFTEKDDVEESSRAAVITLQDITVFRKKSEQQQKQQVRTIEALIGAIEQVNPFLSGHSDLMRRLVELMADKMELGSTDKNTLTTAAFLSQIGRIFVPRELLTKSERLTSDEQAELAKVPEYAYQVLKDIDFGMPVPVAILQMYEKLDGSGTPNGLKGDDITLYGRMLSVVNAFCAMVSPRTFRASLSVDVALDILRKDQGAYDQAAVEALAAVVSTPEGAHAVTSRQAEKTV